MADLFVSDTSNRKVFKVDTTGTSIVYAGSGSSGFIDGTHSKIR